MAAISIGRKKAILMGSTSVLKTLIPPLPPPSVFASSSSSSSIIIRRRRTTTTTTRCSSSSSLANGAAVSRSDIITSHTAKWMQDTSVKSPMQLINEVPPIKVEGRIVACEGDSNPALGHPIEFICLDLDEPAICKYCGLRYVQDHGSHHH